MSLNYFANQQSYFPVSAKPIRAGQPHAPHATVGIRGGGMVASTIKNGESDRCRLKGA
jgi:hypothetical protein